MWSRSFECAKHVKYERTTSLLNSGWTYEHHIFFFFDLFCLVLFLHCEICIFLERIRESGWFYHLNISRVDAMCHRHNDVVSGQTGSTTDSVQTQTQSFLGDDKQNICLIYRRLGFVIVCFGNFLSEWRLMPRSESRFTFKQSCGSSPSVRRD